MIERYTTPEMKKIFTEKHKYENWLLVEILSCEAFVELGNIPKEDFLKIKKNATFTVAEIEELEAETKHDIIAFTRTISKYLGPEKKWVHYGLTSTDVVDTAQAITLKEANDIIAQELWKFIETLKNIALKYKNTVMIGRTHGIHAEVTTFGYKVALWYDEFLRNHKRFFTSRRMVEVGKISGSVGNYAHIDPFVQDFVCGKLGINSSNVSSQTLQRDRHAEYMCTLAIIASGLEKIGIELRHLQRTEVNEVQEGFSKGQKGSSSMPHKKNPISSENIAGLARVVRGNVIPAFENIGLWHERDISHSSAERIILADSITLVHYMLRRMNSVMENLVVNEEKMRENIYLTNGSIFSQRVTLYLIDEKKYSRENAYDIIQAIAIKSYSEGISFEKLLSENKELKLTKAEIKTLMDPNYFCNKIDFVFKRLGLK